MRLVVEESLLVYKTESKGRRLGALFGFLIG